MKPPKVDYKPRMKNKKGGGLQAAKTRKILREEAHKVTILVPLIYFCWLLQISWLQEFVRITKNKRTDLLAPVGINDGASTKPPSVLDRFKPKSKKKPATEN